MSHMLAYCAQEEEDAVLQLYEERSGLCWLMSFYCTAFLALVASCLAELGEYFVRFVVLLIEKV
jgi:hypothetical protein